jgi:hypothetical protein
LLTIYYLDNLLASVQLFLHQAVYVSRWFRLLLPTPRVRTRRTRPEASNDRLLFWSRCSDVVFCDNGRSVCRISSVYTG